MSETVFGEVLASRELIVLNIPPGEPRQFSVSADYFSILTLSADIELSVNDRPVAPVRVLDALQGPAGLRSIKTLKFFNRTGGTVTGTVLYGVGVNSSQNRVNLADATVDLTTSALAAINPAGVAKTPGTSRLVNRAETFSAKKVVSVYIVTGPVSVLGESYATGFTKIFDMSSNARDYLGPIAVDATAGEAVVDFIDK